MWYNVYPIIMEISRNLPTTELATDPDFGLKYHKIRVNETVNFVLNVYLNREIDERCVAKSVQGEFIAGTRPVYLDALKRGVPILEQKIKSVGYQREMHNGRALIDYDSDGVVISWRIRPNSGDAFERSRIIRKMREEEGEETSGSVLLGTDPLLVEAALKEGFALQDAAVAEFINIHSHVLSTEANSPVTLSRINYPRDEFEKVKSVYDILRKKAEGSDISDVYIRDVLLPGDPVLKILHDVRRTASQIDSLRDFLESIKYDSRTKSENSWVIELLTNPKFLDNPDALRFPRTSVQRVMRVSKFVMDLKVESGASADRFTFGCGLLAMKTVEDNREKLHRIAEDNGLSPELFADYVTHLVAYYLEGLPEESWAMGNVTSALNGEFLLDRKVPATERPRVNSSRSKNRLFVVDKRTFADNFLVSGKFIKMFFKELSEDERRETIEACLNIIKGKDDYRPLISILLKSLNISYKAREQCFVLSPNKEDLKKNPWVADVALNAFDVLKAMLSDGDEKLMTALSGIITDASLPFFLSKLNLPSTYGSLEKAVGHVSGDFLFREISFEEAVIKMRKAFAARVVMSNATVRLELEKSLFELGALIERREKDKRNVLYFVKKVPARSADELREFYKVISQSRDLREEAQQIRMEFYQKGLPWSSELEVRSKLIEVLDASAQKVKVLHPGLDLQN